LFEAVDRDCIVNFSDYIEEIKAVLYTLKQYPFLKSFQI